MMKASGHCAEIQLANVPFLDHAYDLAASGIIPGGTRSNMEFTTPEVGYSSNISSVYKALLNDAQTSGGLLFSLPGDQAVLIISELKTIGKQAYLIGNVVNKQIKKIIVR
jgi:selenide,water dikinase